MYGSSVWAVPVWAGAAPRACPGVLAGSVSEEVLQLVGRFRVVLMSLWSKAGEDELHGGEGGGL